MRLSMKALSLLASVIAVATVPTAPSQAATSASAEPSLVATYRDWMVYRTEVGSDMICYAVVEPSSMEPTTVNHGNVFFMVSSWQSGAASNQPSFMTGYELKDSPPPLVRVGSDRWTMFPSGEESFIEADAQEGRLVTAMRRGTEMRVSATSERGTATEYSFSLLGVSAALDRMAQTCR